MEQKGSNWLRGCGIGCGVVLLLGIVLFVGSIFWVRGFMREFDAAIETRESLDARFGQPGEFVPWPDGAIPGDRMESFLEVRDATEPARERISGFFTMIPENEEAAHELESKSFLQKLRFGLSMGRAGFGMVGDVSDFFILRNQALESADMGLGEYTYIYVTAYYAWLGHDPADEPTRTRVTVVEDGVERSATVGDIDDVVENLPPGTGVREDVLESLPASQSGRWQTPRARDEYVAQLRNLLGSISDTSLGEEHDVWVATLSNEVEALENDRRRIPWRDGLPDPIRESLERFRDRLEATYDPATNPFELSRNRKQGLSIHAD
jgi:hypothetical protein